MSEISKVFYSSENGDEWSLVIDTEIGRTSVRHTPNQASGGKITMTTLKDFLATEKETPQNQALHRYLDDFRKGDG
jgi:hypothetical protein